MQALSSGTALKGKAKNVPGEAGLVKCMEQLSQRYDPAHGGFGSEPKFPQPSNFNFLFTYADMYKGSGEEQHAIEMSLHTLRCMAKGGIHDHVAKVSLLDVIRPPVSSQILPVMELDLSFQVLFLSLSESLLSTAISAALPRTLIIQCASEMH